jgi:hypothetical protein
MPVPTFSLLTWYWVVAGSLTQVWAGATRNYVSITDTTYVAWLAAGGVPTVIDTDLHLKALIVPPDYAGQLAAGLVLTWSSTTSLNGTYDCSDVGYTLVNLIQLGLVANKGFPGTISTNFVFVDLAGVSHTFPSAKEWQLLWTALRNYRTTQLANYNANLIGGASLTWASNAVTVNEYPGLTWNMRNTKAFCTDAAGAECFNYSGHISGLTLSGFPWELQDYFGAMALRDYSGFTDPQLAGAAFNSNSAAAISLIITLPATGARSIRLAAGEFLFNASADIDLYDGATVFGNIGAAAAAGAADKYRDATGVVRTSTADWIANNAALTHTFTTTTFTLVMKVGTNSALAHLSVV